MTPRLQKKASIVGVDCWTMAALEHWMRAKQVRRELGPSGVAGSQGSHHRGSEDSAVVASKLWCSKARKASHRLSAPLGRMLLLQRCNPQSPHHLRRQVVCSTKASRRRLQKKNLYFSITILSTLVISTSSRLTQERLQSMEIGPGSALNRPVRNEAAAASFYSSLGPIVLWA